MTSEILSQPRVVWRVIEFTSRGPAIALRTFDEDAAWERYRVLTSAQVVKTIGVDENGDFIPGEMAENVVLARKLNGINQVVRP